MIFPTNRYPARRQAWVVFGLALLLRLAVFEVNLRRDPPRFIEPDSRTYIQTALDLGQHGVLGGDGTQPRWGRVPGYPLLLLIFSTHTASPSRLAMVVLLQCLLGAWMVVVTARSSRALPGGYGVLPAGLLLAAEPSLVAYTNLILSEILYALVLLMAFRAFAHHLERRDRRTLLVLAIALGALPLIRPIGAYFPFVALPLVLWAGWGRIGLRKDIVLFMLLVTTPAILWSWRNYVVLGSFALHSTGPWAQAIFAHNVEVLAGAGDAGPADGFIKPWEVDFGTDQGLSPSAATSRQTDFFRHTILAHAGTAVRHWALSGLFLMGVPDHRLALALLDRPPPVPEASVTGRIAWMSRLGPLSLPVALGMAISLGGLASIPLVLAGWRRWDSGTRIMLGFVMATIAYHMFLSALVAQQGERYRVPIIPFLALMLVSGIGAIRVLRDPRAGVRETP